jgi:hypothetical protein
VGAYFLSEQMPYFGMEVYYDVLTTAGKQFIDLQALLRSLGLGLFDLRFNSFKKLFTDRYVLIVTGGECLLGGSGQTRSSHSLSRCRNNGSAVCELRFFYALTVSLTISLLSLPFALRRLGSPVLNLSYLLDTIMQRVKPLDWRVFWAKQATNKVPLKVRC